MRITLITWIERRMTAGASAYVFGRMRTRNTWMQAPMRKLVLSFKSAWRPWDLLDRSPVNLKRTYGIQLLESCYFRIGPNSERLSHHLERHFG